MRFPALDRLLDQDEADSIEITHEDGEVVGFATVDAKGDEIAYYERDDALPDMTAILAEAAQVPMLSDGGSADYARKKETPVENPEDNKPPLTVIAEALRKLVEMAGEHPFQVGGPAQELATDAWNAALALDGAVSSDRPLLGREPWSWDGPGPCL